MNECLKNYSTFSPYLILSGLFKSNKLFFKIRTHQHPRVFAWINVTKYLKSEHFFPSSVFSFLGKANFIGKANENYKPFYYRKVQILKDS